MNATRIRLELEILEARETPSASPMALGGFDPASVQGIVGSLSGQLGAVLNNINAAVAAFEQTAASGFLSSLSSNLPLNTQGLSPLNNPLGFGLPSMQLGGVNSGLVALLLSGASNSQMVNDPN